MPFERWFASLHSRESLSRVSGLATRSLDCASQGYSTEKSPQGRCRAENSEEGKWDDGRFGGITCTKGRFSYQACQVPRFVQGQAVETSHKFLATQVRGFQQREWTDRQDRRIRQPRQWVDQTFPSWRGPALQHSSLPFQKPSISQHWWILCRYGRCLSAAWNCLVFQTTPSVRLSSHLYLFLNMTQPTRDQPRRLDLQKEDPSLQRGSSIRLRALSALLSDGPRRPRDRPGLLWDHPERPWDEPGTTVSPGIQDHAPHSPDPRQWSPQHERSLHSTSMQLWTWIPREPFRRTRMLRVTARRSLQHNMKSLGKLSLLPRERTRSTLPRLSERPGPLCWTWVRQRFLTECPGWTSLLSRTPWRPRHGLHRGLKRMKRWWRRRYLRLWTTTPHLSSSSR